jgi:hypothetical protein
MKPLKSLNIKESHTVDGHQFYEVKYKKVIAVLWEDDEVLCMPIMRIKNNKERGKGEGTEFFLLLEQLAEENGKIFQISDCPEPSKENKGPMRHIINKYGYKRSIFTRDNWGKEDTIAMWRKNGAETGYTLKTFVRKHLLIYGYYTREPEVKNTTCWLCQSEMDGYVCPRCGQCQRCQCISFGKNSCHLCGNGREEAKTKQVLKTKTIQWRF